jgi:hypothetical protein
MFLSNIRTGLDPSQDTPVEILHTILLGIVKYVWHNLHTSWKETDQNLFVIRLQSTNIDGLSIPCIRAPYMMQYRNGLIGKHFKTLMQTMIFHLHGLVTPEQFTLVKAVGFLGALLWIPEIENMESYLVRFHFACVNCAVYLYSDTVIRLISKFWFGMSWMPSHLLTHPKSY